MLVPEHNSIALKIGNTIINWVVDIQTVTINELAKFVCLKIERFEGLILSFTFEINTQKYDISNDDELRRVLSMYCKQKIHAVKVVVTTPQKPFSEWKLKEAMELYGFGETANIRLLPPFECCREPVEGCIPGLIDNLKEANSSTPFRQYSEATKSIYTWVFLSKIVAVFNSKSDQKFRIRYPTRSYRGTVWKGAS